MTSIRLLVLSLNTLCSIISSATDDLALAIVNIPLCRSGPLRHRS